MDKFAVLMSILIILFGIVLYYVMKPRVQEIPVVAVTETPLDWVPWGWGWGSYNNSGSAVIHRPQPHFPFHRPVRHTEHHHQMMRHTMPPGPHHRGPIHT